MSHHVAIILLAAGGSSRFGSPKQLFPYQGKLLVHHVAEIALQTKVTAVHVILGAEAEKIRPALSGLSVQVVNNSHWEEGISSSLRAGVASLPEQIDAALIMLCDQPLVSTELLNKIIDTHLTTGKPIVASEYAGTLGVPALFTKSLFPELLALHGDAGAKSVIQRHLQDVATVSFPEGAVDIDSPEQQ